ncbi:zinc finger, CCHC-type containing protein [Tanacetum coccineum]
MMLLTMDLEIQRNLAHLGGNNMLIELKALYSKQAEQELLQTVREFYTCKQEEGQSVSSYVLKMKSYIDQLERLGHLVTLNLGVSLILVRLSKEYDRFMQNYNMHSMGKIINELHVMHKLHEETLPKKVVALVLHAIRARKVQGKGKGKMAYVNVAPSYAPKPKNPPPPKKDSPAKDAICHHCGEVGCGTHICNTTQGLRRSKKLNPGALSLAILRDGVYEIEMSCSNTNDSSMYVVSNNRAKLNLDSSLLWHCRLGHISKKCIEKLQYDGLLNSTDIESLGKCVSCMFRKMARKPYSHQVERVKDLLGLMHTDGYEALVKRDTLTKHDKLEPRSFKCIFVGYPKETMEYSFYNPSENKVFAARNAEFFESNLIDQEASRSLEDLKIIQEEDTNLSLDTSLNHEEDDQEIDEPQSDINPIRRSFRTKRAPNQMCLYIDAEEHELGDLGEPANYKAALLDPESEKWLATMNVEMQSTKDNDV